MTTLLTRSLRVTSAGHRTADSPSMGSDRDSAMPVLLTVAEAADLLRTSSRAIYAMVERHQLPGVVRVRRRVLVRTDVLLDWLNQNRAPSRQE